MGNIQLAVEAIYQVDLYVRADFQSRTDYPEEHDGECSAVRRIPGICSEGSVL